MAYWIDCENCNKTFLANHKPACSFCQKEFKECPNCEEEVKNKSSCFVCVNWKGNGNDYGRNKYYQNSRIPLYAPNYENNNHEMELKTVHEEKGFRFFFTDDDILSNEPPHVHIKRRKGSRDKAKIWLRKLNWFHCYGFNVSEQSKIMNITKEKKDFFLEKWKILRGGRE